MNDIILDTVGIHNYEEKKIERAHTWGRQKKYCNNDEKKQAHKESLRKYYVGNKDTIIENNIQYYHVNRDLMRTKFHEYYVDNRDTIR